MSQNPKWLSWARQIQSIAQAGLTYSKDPYDLERFDHLRRLAAEIMAEHTSLPLERLELALGAEEGYLTPKVDVRAAIFNAQGEILLIRERMDGRWSLPGGWCDVGESPREMAVREVAEESGYEVRPEKMLAVFHRAKHDHPPSVWDIYKLFIRCELVGGQPLTSLETDGVGFFGRQSLPSLSTGRVTAGQIRRMFEHYDDPLLPTDFD